jgi:hypothetical protein
MYLGKTNNKQPANMAGIIISPLTQAMIGEHVNEICVDDNLLKIKKPNQIDEVANHNVLNRLVNKLMREIERKRIGGDCDADADALYDNIVGNVYSCKMFSSRRIGMCYVTNKSYSDEEDIRNYVFRGAQTALGARWFYSTFPYHISAAEFMPFVDAIFNFNEYMVPITDFPNIRELAGGKNYITVNFSRTSGAIQKGIVRIGEDSMVGYRVIEGHASIHPSYANPDAKKTAFVTVYFNYDGADVEFNPADDTYPVTDCTKDIPIERLIDSNSWYLMDAFRLDGVDDTVPDFYTAFANSVKRRFNTNVHEYIV